MISELLSHPVYTYRNMPFGSWYLNARKEGEMIITSSLQCDENRTLSILKNKNTLTKKYIQSLTAINIYTDNGE